jgi:Caspase domain
MKGRALLLGSATGALMGVANDVKAMASWLGGLGLSLDVREGPDATRDGMLDGLERLVRDTRPGEAAVVYYSGHGGFSAVRPEVRFGADRLPPRAFQYLVPTDHDKHRRFRGIFRLELSSLMQALSERTTNITVILDCCHSTDMVRDDDLELKAVVEPWSEGIEAHVAWLVEQGYDLDDLPELHNASMVLVSACTTVGRAYEYTRPSDRLRCGLFTDCLLDVMRDAPDPARVTWEAVMRRVVERIQRPRCHQRPQVSGPASRCLFSERRERWSGALSLQRVGERWCLSGGAAAGVMQGDRYSIVDLLSGAAPHPLAEVVVSNVEGHSAVVSVLTAKAELEAGMTALARPGGPTHQRCVVDGAGALAERLRRSLAAVAGLEVVGGEDRAGAAFVVEVRGEQIEVLDAEGRALRRPWVDAAALEPSVRCERLDGLVEELRTLARASDLLTLARREGLAERPRSLPHVFEWGRVEGGAPHRLPSHGAELSVGDRIYVAVENTGARPIYVSMLDVGVGRAVVLLNRSEPEGVDLAAEDTEILGAPELGSLVGIELVWPDDVPLTGAREESLVVFISSGPLPVGSWETASTLDRAPMRDMEPEARRPRSPVYTVRHVSFTLNPRRNHSCS